MSYTFSRRDFMKYTALTAVAIAGSGMLTGCSNPNRPVWQDRWQHADAGRRHL